MDFKQIPIIINNRDRLSTLKLLVNWLESHGSQNIFIVDNASTYEPLLEYYRRIQHKVFYLRENVGYLAFWELGIYEQFQKSFYVYTDPDVLPVESCPNDYLEVFLEGLQRYPTLGKVGFSLKIDDLPDLYLHKNEVIRHEAKFSQRKLESRYFDAMIDTTFALYRPFTKGGHWVPAARTSEPYSARHLPWYVDSNNLDEEELFYRQHANLDASWSKAR